MIRSNIVVVTAIVVGIAVLCGLGTWQLQRLAWKEALIGEVEQRRTGEPVELPDIESIWAQTHDVDYLPVRLSGTFEHSAEQYYYNTHDGNVGWNVYTPFKLNDSRVIFVNRGFVPDALRDPQVRGGGLISGPVEITGLARNPVAEKPNRFMPDNEPERRLFFWRSLPEMASAVEIGSDRLVPFFVDADATPNPGGWPRGGTTRISFPNNHLQYALTWFGLAAALAGVGGYFVFGRLSRAQA